MIINWGNNTQYLNGQVFVWNAVVEAAIPTAFESDTDFDDFFDVDEFAINVVLNSSGTTIQGILDDAFEIQDLGGGQAVDTNPQILCKRSDVISQRKGNTVNLPNNVTYKITQKLPGIDDTVLLMLSRD